MNIEKICVVGCGYVGLPLAVLLSKHFKVFGLDVNEHKIEMLKQGQDPTGDVENLHEANIEFSIDPSVIGKSDFVIVCVPTPITKNKQPDLSMLKSASEMVGTHMKKSSMIVYESTVYPGVTEEECLPILETKSGLELGTDFKIGYSPERVNPGDKKHTIDKIIKVISANDAEGLKIMEEVYGTICKAGLHKAPSIKVAEAAKVIENTQRDINIALMNELSLIFERLKVDTNEVLAAAKTKWNFLDFHPGLVGGHCIGVDPYYLAFKAEELDYHPQIILAGRRVNDYMPLQIALRTLNLLNECEKIPKKSKILVMGLTFKENVRDTRNSQIKKVIQFLKHKGIHVIGCDPLAENTEEFDLDELLTFEGIGLVDGIIIASPHEAFKKIELDDMRQKINGRGFIIDIKGTFKPKMNGTEPIYESL